MVVEWSVTATFLFLEDVNLRLELCMRSDRTRFSNNLTSLDVLLVDTTEKKTNVVSSLTLIKKLTEHLDTSYSGSSRSVTETNELNRIIHVDSTSLDTAGNNSTTTGD